MLYKFKKVHYHAFVVLIYIYIAYCFVFAVSENKILSQLLSIETQLDKLYVNTDQEADEDELRFLATVSDLADRELVITISWAKQVPGNAKLKSCVV